MYYDSSQINRTPKIVSAKIDKMNEITLETNFPFSLSDGKFAGFTLEGVQIKEIHAYKENETMTNKIKIITKDNLDLKKTYKISKQLFGTATVEMGAAIRSEEFDNFFYYDGNDLGNKYAKNKSFRLWAPTASEAKLVTYNKWDDQIGNEINMNKLKKEHGKHEIKGNQEGLFYTYKVKIGDKVERSSRSVCTCRSVNGDKGVVVDLEELIQKMVD